MKFVELKNKRFGQLVVIERTDNIGKQTAWLCVCDCGKQVVVTGSHLKNGHTKSCGCLRKKVKHGMWGTPTYNSWHAMLQRCLNPNTMYFKDYGGRGIKVCDEWLNSFENFFADMGLKPSPELTIERVNNGGNYCKENCIWATQTAQLRNQRMRNTNTSGYVGVYWNKRNRNYQSCIGVNYKNINLGSYDTLEEAIEARRQGELKYWSKEIK